MAEDERERAYRESQSNPTLISDDFLWALVNSGVIDGAEKIRRVVIDATVGEVCKLYIERYGDNRMLAISTSLQGTKMQVVAIAEEEGETPAT